MWKPNCLLNLITGCTTVGGNEDTFSPRPEHWVVEHFTGCDFSAVWGLLLHMKVYLCVLLWWDLFLTSRSTESEAEQLLHPFCHSPDKPDTVAGHFDSRGYSNLTATCKIMKRGRRATTVEFECWFMLPLTLRIVIIDKMINGVKTLTGIRATVTNSIRAEQQICHRNVKSAPVKCYRMTLTKKRKKVKGSKHISISRLFKSRDLPWRCSFYLPEQLQLNCVIHLAQKPALLNTKVLSFSWENH